MKILVRNTESSQYLKQTGVYTAVFDDAVDFLCAELAFDFFTRHKLKSHEVLAAEEDG